MERRLGAQMLRMMIEWWEEYGSDFKVPASVRYSTKIYTENNNSLRTFIANNCVKADGEKILMRDFVDALKSTDDGYAFYQSECRNNARLISLLRSLMSEDAVKRGTGNRSYLVGYKLKAWEEEED
mmetsp:Transcript_36530/g.86747  ORF Transcript_36530/g.86747 Transcript_36530/m.86747 type:complete len:126 (+) Transcript_36530:1341-1718(+)